MFVLQDDLVAAAQQEAAERHKAKHHNKLHKAKHAEAASMAQDILQGPAGFAHFTERLARLYKQYGIERPSVVLEYKDINVTTKVRQQCSSCSLGTPFLKNARGLVIAYWLRKSQAAP